MLTILSLNFLNQGFIIELLGNFNSLITFMSHFIVDSFQTLSQLYSYNTVAIGIISSSLILLAAKKGLKEVLDTTSKLVGTTAGSLFIYDRLSNPTNKSGGGDSSGS
jgi:hypothetical protein